MRILVPRTPDPRALEIYNLISSRIVDAAHIAALDMIRLGAYARTTRTPWQFRVDLVARHAQGPGGVVGPLFRMTARNPDERKQPYRLMFGITNNLAKLVRRQPGVIELVEEGLRHLA